MTAIRGAALSLLCLSLAYTSETQETTQMRQVPFLLPLRLPRSIPDDAPIMIRDPIDMSAPISFDGGVVPLSALTGPVPFPESQESPEMMSEQGEVPPQILDLVRALANRHSGAAPPSFPFPTDGIHLKVRASKEMPAPLRMEEAAKGLRIAGKLPSNLTSAALNIKHQGNVVSVMYRVGEDMGVEQRFEFSFEPEELGAAHYKRATGDFSLDVPVPVEPNMPKEVHILFDESPAPTQAPKKVAKAAKLDTSKASPHLLKVSLHKADHADNLKTPATLAKMSLHKTAKVADVKSTVASGNSIKAAFDKAAKIEKQRTKDELAKTSVKAEDHKVEEKANKKKHTSRDVNPTTKKHVGALRAALGATEPAVLIEIVG